MLVTAVAARRDRVSPGEARAFRAVNGLPDSLYLPAWAIMHTENGFISSDELVETVTKIRKVDAIYTKDFSDLLGIRASIVTAVT